MRRKHKGLTLNSLVTTLLIVFLLLTLFISTMVGYQSNKDSLINNTLELNQINAEKLAVTTNDLLVSAKQTLLVSARYLATVSSDEQRLFNLQLVKESNHIFNSVFIADEEGVTRHTIPENIGLIGKKLESQAVKIALNEQVPLISEPYVGITGRYIILVSHPIFDAEGIYKGFIGGSIYLSEPNVFEVLLGSSTSNETGSYVYVVSKKGELLNHPEKHRIGDIVSSNKVVEHVLQGHTGSQQVINSKNLPMLAGYAPVAEVGWGIVSQTPAATVMSTSKLLVTNIFIISSPIMIILLIIVLLITRYMASPLYNLASFAESLSTDNPKTMTIPAIHHWNYEANELHKTLQKAFSSMQSQIHTLSLEAKHDKLTGLYNRRSMDSMLIEWSNNQIPISYTIIDIDHFKTVNDTFGHHMGDEVLAFLAQLMLQHAAPEDVCCRYGGEEFVILSPRSSLEEAYSLAEKIRNVVQHTISPVGRSITISAGIAHYSPEAGDLEGVKQRADLALYHSKQTGRNKVSKEAGI